MKRKKETFNRPKNMPHTRLVYLENKKRENLYRRHIVDLLKQIKPILNNPGWKLIREADNCRFFQFKPEDEGFAYNLCRRVVISKRMKSREFLEFVEESCFNPKYEKLAKSCDPTNMYFLPFFDFGKKPKFYCVHLRYTPQSFRGIVKDRDYVTVETTLCHSKVDKSIRIGGSIDHLFENPTGVKIYPHDENCVRGIVQIYAFIARRLNYRQMEIIHLSKTDPKGQVPPFIFDYGSLKQTSNINLYLNLYLEKIRSNFLRELEIEHMKKNKRVVVREENGKERIEIIKV